MGEGWIHGSEEGRSSTHDDARPDFALILTHFLVPPPPLSSVASQYDLSAADLLAHSEQDLWGSRPTKRALLAKRGGARGLSEIRDVLGNAAFTHTQSQIFPGSIHRRRLFSISKLAKAAVAYGGDIVKKVIAIVPKVTGLSTCR